MRRLVFLAVLAGCTTVGPDYQRPEIPLPKEYPEAAPSQVAPSAAIPADWWRLYQDPKLDELVAAGRKGNADVRLAIARVQEAEGALREVRAAVFPEVNATASYTRQGVSTVSQPPVPSGISTVRPNYSALLSTSYEIDFWGRVSRAGEAARAGLLSNQLSREVVDLTLAGGIAQAYFALRSLDAQIAVLDNSIRVRRESLDIAKTRLDAGLASELDVYQAQGALSDALVQRREATRSRALIEHQLAQLVARPDLKLTTGELFDLPMPPLPPAGLPSTLLERRPDIRQAEETLVAANAQIGVARAALAAPIFDAGRREARVDQARARREQAVATYQRAIETGFREVADALVNVQQTLESEEELKVRLDAARNALELSTLRYQSGYSPYLEVLDAQRTANDAELAFVRNRQARLAFSVDFIKALGGGWDPSRAMARN